MIHGEAQDAESDLVDGRHSPPMVRSAAAIHPSLEIPSKCRLGRQAEGVNDLSFWL